MMKVMKEKKGQFIIIAVMIVAIMMVSLAATMYNVATYYEYENWEEYITLVDHIKLNTIRLAEISLANYTAGNLGSPETLSENLQQWQRDSTRAYVDKGIVLTYDLANGSHHIYGISTPYSKGFALRWNETFSFSAANVTCNLDMASIGLTGYKFEAAVVLGLEFLNSSGKTIYVSVKKEDGMPVTDLEKNNFEVGDLNIAAVTSVYDWVYLLVYRIECYEDIPDPVSVSVWDTRGIKVVSRSSP